MKNTFKRICVYLLIAIVELQTIFMSKVLYCEKVEAFTTARDVDVLLDTNDQYASLDKIYTTSDLAFTEEWTICNSQNKTNDKTSDLFYSYPSLLLYATGIQEHSTKLAMIEAEVVNEYVTTPAFYVSSILYGTSIATNKKDLTKFIFDKVGVTNFAEEKYMENANTKLLEKLCAYNFDYGWFSEANNLTSSGKDITKELGVLNQIFKYTNKASEYVSLQNSMNKEQLYKDYFSYALAELKDECTHINPNDWTIINGQYYTYSSEISEALSSTTDIINFITGFSSSILTYDYYLAIVDEILTYAPQNSDLYIGMQWQKQRLQAGFITAYGIDKVKDELLNKIIGFGDKLIKEFDGKDIDTFNKSKTLFDLVRQYVMTSTL